MSGSLQPLDDKFPIVGPDGRPTMYFIQWAQQKQIDITGAITAEQFNILLLQYLFDHQLLEGDGIALTPSGNISDIPEISVRNGTGLNFDGMGNIKLADTAVTPGTYGDATHVGQFTVDQQGRITAAQDVAISGAGGSSWSLHGSTTIAVPTATAPFTGLAGVTEIMLVCHGLTMSASDVPIVQVSTDNGSNYYTTSGDYVRIPASGAVSNATNGASFWNANATAARSGIVTILACNVTGAPRMFRSTPNDSSPGGLFLADNANDIDAVRVRPNGAANMTGGTIYCFKR